MRIRYRNSRLCRLGGLLIIWGSLLGACANSDQAPDLQATVDAAVAATISAQQGTAELSLTDTTPAPTPAATPLPTPTMLHVGTEMDGVGRTSRTPGFRFTVTGCAIRPARLDGPYSGGGFYTFTALPGMRFVMLTFSFVNDWVRQQGTPSLTAGEVETDVGRFYRVWSPPVGIFSVDYQPRPALEPEIDGFAVDSGAFETLLPGKSTTGSISFEIPEDEDPVIARVTGLPIPIDLAGCGT